MRFRFYMMVLGVLLCALWAPAEIIHLKNGRTIPADQVRDAGDIIEYDQGENSFAIPKTVVERIEAGQAPSPAAATSALTDAGSAESLLETPGSLFVAPEASAMATPVEPGHATVARTGLVDREALRQRVSNALTTSDYHALAMAYDAFAVQSAVARDTSTASYYLRLAMGIEPNSALLLAHYAGLQISAQQYADALPYAERAARLAPDRADVLALLGFASFFSDRTAAAITAWKRSLALRPDANIAKFLAKAEREQRAQANFGEQDTGHFTLHYEGSQSSPQLRKELLDALEADFNELVLFFGISPRQSIPVVLYSAQAFTDVTQAPAWAEALNDGKLRIPVENVDSVTPELARVLKHELTHSFINQITHARCPQWLNEGTAQLMEGAGSSHGAALARIYAEHRQLPLATLEGPFTNLPAGTATLAYSEALTAVEYIRDQNSVSDVVSMLKRIGQGMTGEEALRATIHSSYGDLDDEIGRSLQNRYRH